MTNTPRVTNFINISTLVIVIINFACGGFGWFYYDRHLKTEKLRLAKLEADITNISLQTASIKNKANLSLNLKEIIDDVTTNISIGNLKIEPFGNDRMAIIIPLKNIGKTFVDVSLLQMDISESTPLLNTAAFSENSLIKLNQLTGYSRQDDSSYKEKTDKYPIASKMEKLLVDSEYAYSSMYDVLGPGKETNLFIFFTINKPKRINYFYRYSLALRSSPKRLNLYINALEAEPTLKNQLISFSSSISLGSGQFFLKETDNMISVQDF